MNNSKLFTEMFQDAESVVQLIGEISGASVNTGSTGPVMEIQVREKPDLTGAFLPWPEALTVHEGNHYDGWTMMYMRFTERVIVWWAVHDNV